MEPGIYNEFSGTERHTVTSKVGYGVAFLQKIDDNKFHPVYSRVYYIRSIRNVLERLSHHRLAYERINTLNCSKKGNGVSRVRLYDRSKTRLENENNLT